MILDHLATRLLADHGHDWADTLVRAASGLRRWLRRALSRRPNRHDKVGSEAEIGGGSS